MKYWVEIDQTVLAEKNVYSLASNEIQEGARVLEIGASYGHFTSYLVNKKKCTVSAIEINPDAKSSLEKFSKKVFIGNLEKDDWFSSFEGQNFDIILVMDVFEHLRDPGSVLKRIKLLMNGQTKLIVSVPNIAHNSVLACLLDDQFKYNDFGLLDKTHVHFFAFKELVPFFRQADLYVNAIDGVLKNFDETENIINPHRLTSSMLNALEQHKLGQVYQFFVVSKTTPLPGVVSEVGEDRLKLENSMDDKYDHLRNELNSMYNSKAGKLILKLKKLAALFR